MIESGLREDGGGGCFGQVGGEKADLTVNLSKSGNPRRSVTPSADLFSGVVNHAMSVTVNQQEECQSFKDWHS